MEPDGYDVGTGLCAGCVCRNVGTELEACPDHYEHCSGAGGADLVFPEQNPPVEPESAQDQLPYHQWLQ